MPFAQYFGLQAFYLSGLVVNGSVLSLLLNGSIVGIHFNTLISRVRRAWLTKFDSPRTTMRSFFLHMGLALSNFLCLVVDGVSGHPSPELIMLLFALTAKQQDSHTLAENMDTRMSSDPMGFQHVGMDGILRLFNQAGEVVGYSLLTRGQLLKELANSPLSVEEKEELTRQWSNIATSQVSSRQIYEPPHYLLPPRLVDPEAFRLQHEKRELQPPRTSVPRGLREKPNHCTELDCLKTSDCLPHNCPLCKFFGRHPVGRCVTHI
ncbi:hypothetical protein AJ78_05137 [Emergomyces pasteurianus Ep9510]|uniref:Uncharacterized protein n=1 Tax=Emergomyces pasteurianus Ep9510 TaxID=1447872 RepID=A0A1J9Q2U3_9EURO|nr:hypothetical protein AJ78_05137 [Emergomyces pasteurianus Ep9510]